MHFFYLDEAGDTGEDLKEQKIFVLGGLSVSDEKWKTLEDSFRKKLSIFFKKDIPDNFELHSEKMRNKKDEWRNYTFDELNTLTLEIIDLVISNGHKIHFMVIDKDKMIKNEKLEYKNPYFYAYEYIINYTNSFIKKCLGKTARGIFIIDEKKDTNGDNVYYKTIKQITDKCRYNIAKANRLKRIVEFTYPIDSKKNNMIQISDLIVYCIKKYFEYKLKKIEENPVAEEFYTNCFNKIYNGALWRKTYVDCTMLENKKLKDFNETLKDISVYKESKWK